jgi:hypothetical protein
LHRLDNAKKHTVITPIAAAVRIGQMTIIAPNGATAATFNNFKVSVGQNGPKLVRVSKGARVEIDEKATSAIDIMFGDIESFKFHFVVPTLTHLSEAVANCFNQFATFIETRS